MQCLVIFAVVFQQYIPNVENIFNPKNRSGTFAACTVRILENSTAVVAHEFRNNALNLLQVFRICHLERCNRHTGPPHPDLCFDLITFDERRFFCQADDPVIITCLDEFIYNPFINQIFRHDDDIVDFSVFERLYDYSFVIFNRLSFNGEDFHGPVLLSPDSVHHRAHTRHTFDYGADILLTFNC